MNFKYAIFDRDNDQFIADDNVEPDPEDRSFAEDVYNAFLYKTPTDAMRQIESFGSFSASLFLIVAVEV